jgi:hypothetical protein
VISQTFWSTEETLFPFNHIIPFYFPKEEQEIEGWARVVIRNGRLQNLNVKSSDFEFQFLLYFLAE